MTQELLDTLVFYANKTDLNSKCCGVVGVVVVVGWSLWCCG
jgi:hypothetical protein